MELKPGYKQTEVGVIPEDWEVAKTGDVCDCIVPGRNKPKLFDGDIPWITTPDLEDRKYVTTSRLGLCVSPLEAKAIGSKIVPSGSVLMSCAGELGIVAVTQNELVVNQQLHVFLPRDTINTGFLASALTYRKVDIEGFGTKTAVPYLNKNSCNSIVIPLPPLAEQRAIAEALSDVDALLDGLDRLIAKQRDLKQATMQQLLTGQTRLPGFTGEWEVKRLGECLLSRPDYGINAAAVAFSDKLPSYIRITDISEYGRFSPNPQVSVKALNAELYYLRDGDVVFARTGASVGKSYLYDRRDGDLVFAGFLIRVRPNPELLVSAFLAAHTATKPYWNWVRLMSMRSGQPGINGNEFAQMPLPLPPLAEQTAIAAVLTDMDAELAALEARRAKTRLLKQAMMQELLTGKTRLT